MNTMIMRGAWITPNGNIFYTDNARSHESVIQEMGIEEILKSEGQKMEWDEYDRRMHLDINLPHISLRLGYVRIIVFDSQFSIESYERPGSDIIKCIKEVYEHFKFIMGYEFTNFSIELVKSGVFLSFDSIQGVLKQQ